MQIGTGWSGITAIVASSDVDGRADPYGCSQLWARKANGDLVGYELYADGTFVPGEVFSEGGGWTSMLLTS